MAGILFELYIGGIAIEQLARFILARVAREGIDIEHIAKVFD